MEDRELLREVGQRFSTVISARTGRTTDYMADLFECSVSEQKIFC